MGNIVDGIIIEPLTPERAADFLEFFDDVAFLDNKDWSECYCQFYYYANEDKVWENITVEENRKNTVERIASGGMNGYLAYLDGKVTGWCNAGRKTMFTRLVCDESLTDTNDASILSVVCYIIAPELRRRGVAGKLLQRVCEDARKDGYAFVEAYPRLGDLSCAQHYHGPLELYLKEGFSIYKALNGLNIVRLKV